MAILLTDYQINKKLRENIDKKKLKYLFLFLDHQVKIWYKSVKKTQESKITFPWSYHFIYTSKFTNVFKWMKQNGMDCQVFKLYPSLNIMKEPSASLPQMSDGMLACLSQTLPFYTVDCIYPWTYLLKTCFQLTSNICVSGVKLWTLFVECAALLLEGSMFSVNKKGRKGEIIRKASHFQVICGLNWKNLQRMILFQKLGEDYASARVHFQK